MLATSADVPVALAVTIAAALGIGILALGTHGLTRGLGADRRWMAWLVAGTTAARVALALGINASDRLVVRLGGDANLYHDTAVLIAEHWNGEGPLPGYIADGKEGFYYALGGLYWLLGPHRLVGLVLDVVLASLVVPVTADTARRLFGAAAYRPAALLVAVLPGFVLWSSQLLREGPILLALALALNLAVRLVDRISVPLVVGTAATVAVLLTLRSNVAALLLPGLLAGIALGRRSVVGLAAVAAATAFGLAAVVGGIDVGRLGPVTAYDLQDIEAVRRDLALSAESGFLPDADVSTVPGALRYLPLGVVNVAFGPFPWQATNARQIGGAVDSLLVWAMVPSLWRGWRAARPRIGRVRYVVALPAACTLLGLSLLLGNYGAVVRERLQVLVLLAPLVALGWVVRRPRSGWRRPGTALAGEGDDAHPGDGQAGTDRRRRDRVRAGPGHRGALDG